MLPVLRHTMDMRDIARACKDADSEECKKDSRSY